MVNTCCVPNCRGNYPKTIKVQVFSFPKEPNLKSTWIRAIRRENFVPTDNTKVCRQHFTEEDVITQSSFFDERTGRTITFPLKRPRLREGAVPTQFPNCPKYLSASVQHRESMDQRRERLEQQSISTAISESIVSKAAYDAGHTFSTFSELVSCLQKKTLADAWTQIIKEDQVLLILLDEKPAPTISASVLITKDLVCSVFLKDVNVKELEKYVFPKSLCDINDLTIILELLYKMATPGNSECQSDNLQCILHLIKGICPDSDEENEMLLAFIAEQLQLFFCKKKENRRYSPHSSVFFSILFSISPHAYRFLRNSGCLIMPHPRTIRKMCSPFHFNPVNEQSDANFLMHIKQKFSSLEKCDIKVVLMVDEIYVKPYIDYKAGNIVGMAQNTEKAATTAQVFMVQSLLSSFKEVVHILPVVHLNADGLHEVIKRVITGLHGIGFHVICIVSDNNTVNRKAMSFFASPPKVSIVYPHPCLQNQPLFFIIDSVHVFKCIRNNWINQKSGDQGLYYPYFDDLERSPLACASFKALKELHQIEVGSLLKYAYGLSLKALYPSNMEKQNVKLVQKIFNRHVVEALLSIGKRHGLLNHQTTADFIRLINNWWNVVNVKTPLKGQRHRDPLQEPIVGEPNENVRFLERFLIWLDAWAAKRCTTGTFTKETHWAVSHTTHGLLEMSKYCLEDLKFSYFLPGKVQTDCLEDRFGKYRTLAGSQYLISVRQIFECEAKLRLQNSLPHLKLESSLFGVFKVSVTESSNSLDLPASQADDLGNAEFGISVQEEDFKSVEHILPVITYLADCCARAAIKNLKCDFCGSSLVLDKPLDLHPDYELVRAMDNGALLYPSADVVNAIIYNYIVIKKLLMEKNEKKFLKKSNQRQVAMVLTIKLISEHEFFLLDDTCENGHSSDFVLKLIIKASTNSLLKNYCSQRNDSCAPIPKKRKLHTVAKN